MFHIKKIEPHVLKGNVILPESKSIANRIMLIRALSGLGPVEPRQGESHDISLLRAVLFSNDEYANLEDAGTPLRFFLAYAAVKRPGIVMDGNARLRERPIAPLLQVLVQMGAEFEYMEIPGSLPLKVTRTIDSKQLSVEVDASLSSQFLSALLLIAPCLEHGLDLKVRGLNSAPYVFMTIELMRRAGAKIDVRDERYLVSPGGYNVEATVYSEPDWSAAAHIYGLVSASSEANIFLQGLSLTSVQGDKAAAKIFRHLGVMTQIEEHGLRLTKGQVLAKKLEVDFTDTPDLFPAVVAACAFHRIDAHFKGTRNLFLKESDRVEAMKINLAQTGCVIEKLNENEVQLSYQPDTAVQYAFKSFSDHRIAMACSIFAFKKDIFIDDEMVVRKSFPGFWDQFFAITRA